MNGDADGGKDGKAKRRKVAPEGFLDCGSASWSILLAIFFLSLHKGAPSEEHPLIVPDQ